MKINWSYKAIRDLERVIDFALTYSLSHASSIEDKLTTAPDALLHHPQRGMLLHLYSPREVRRLLIDNYEIRYEIKGDNILIIEVWHGKEDR